MVEPLCRLLGTSRRGFSRAVTDSLGISAKEWLRRERIVAAVRLLREDVAVKEVAAQLGFPHAAAFTNEFGIWVGMCPSVWRIREKERVVMQVGRRKRSRIA
jgi:AraC-like DNA-binding protein